MNEKTSGFDDRFIEKQRVRLTQLRDQLAEVTQAGDREAQTIHREASGEAREYEDDGQKLAMLEIDGVLVNRDLQRLDQIERALRRIEEGTYGFSAVSGKPIPRERLEAVPEATLTLAEEELAEPKLA